MRGRDILSRYNVPSAFIKPDLGKSAENVPYVGSSSQSETWDIFHDEVGRSYLVNQSERFREHISVILSSKAVAGDREGGAWRTRSDDIHDSTPGSSVEGLDVSSPDGSVIQESVALTLADDLLAVFVPFDIGDRPEVGVRVGESEAEGESAVPAETVENVESGMYIHVMVTP
jgi:hypothetical protein